MHHPLIKTCFIFSLLAFAACKSKDKNTDVTIRFENISSTNGNGIPLGSPDPDDWRTNDAWFSKESNLFAGIPEQSICSEDADVDVFDAYPNPCTSSFHFYMHCRAGTHLELRLVNQDFQVLRTVSKSGLLAGNNVVDIQVDDLNARGQTLRLYYKLIDGNCEFRGHGDILVQ